MDTEPYLIITVQDEAIAPGPFRGGTPNLEPLSNPNRITSIEIADLKPREAILAAKSKNRIVQPELTIKLISPISTMEPKASTHNVTNSKNTWGIEATGVADSKYDGSGVKVAVLDTGIVDHPAFDGLNILKKDFTGEGIDDLHGHGTHCAGTIAGRSISGEPRFGVAPNIDQLLVAKVIHSKNGGSSLALVKAIQWAMQKGADIISMSIGFDLASSTAKMIKKGWPAELAASRALQAYRANIRAFTALANSGFALSEVGAGSLLIAAAGNESKRRINRNFVVDVIPPAAAPSVLAVGALGYTRSSRSNLVVAPFSNTSPDLSAPGVDILSAWNDGSTKSISGTSMATPHVAGIAALWVQHNRELIGFSTPDSLQISLKGGARKEVFKDGYAHIDVGHGLVIAP